MRYRYTEKWLDLKDLCVPIEDCVCVELGLVSKDKLDILIKHNYDQAPVRDSEKGSFICGLVETRYLKKLWKAGHILKKDDPHVNKQENKFYIGAMTSIFSVLERLRKTPSVLVIQHGDAGEYGYMEFVLGLLTVSDLNKHPVRLLVYSFLSELEALLAQFLQATSDPWDWISLLSEDQQVRILGYWELARKKKVDTTPISSATLSNLITVIGKSPNLRSLLGYQSRKAFDKETGSIPEFRNRIMHPVRPLILNQNDVNDLLHCLEKVKALSDLLQNILEEYRK